METIQEQNAALGRWAGKVLAGSRPRRTRRLSKPEAWSASRKVRLFARRFGHYPKQ